MTVTWTTPSKANGVITHYEVQVGSFATQTSGTTSHTQRGLTPFQEYQVKVRACTNAGCGLFSQIPVKTNEASELLWVVISKLCLHCDPCAQSRAYCAGRFAIEVLGVKTQLT